MAPRIHVELEGRDFVLHLVGDVHVRVLNVPPLD
jgi:hypothetical protein